MHILLSQPVVTLNSASPHLADDITMVFVFVTQCFTVGPISQMLLGWTCCLYRLAPVCVCGRGEGVSWMQLLNHMECLTIMITAATWMRERALVAGSVCGWVGPPKNNCTERANLILGRSDGIIQLVRMGMFRAY